MKKVFIVLAVAILAMGYAQAQITFGARAGLNLSNFAQKNDGKKPSGDFKGKYKPGFQIGVVGEYSITEAFAIQPGILFTTLGTRYKYSGGGYEGKETINLNYIQIPINAQYKLDLSGMTLLLQAGPYFGFGIGGKYKWDDIDDGEKDKGDAKIKFGDGDDYDVYYVDNALDFGLGLGAGLQFDNIQVGVGYNIGLANMSDANKTSMKNHGLAITVTYLFGK